jgi:hypothetical protein
MKIKDKTIEEIKPVGQSLPATTTHQEDKVTDRQSRINLIWEITQAIIAISITMAIICINFR